MPSGPPTSWRSTSRGSSRPCGHRACTAAATTTGPRCPRSWRSRAGRARSLRARRATGAPDFDRHDLRAVDVLVTRADAWLAGPADGAEEVPERAVVRVRASVERLDGLAVRGAPAAHVTAELHELERAVAALLGTAGLPASAVPHQRSGPVGEWTTTGAVR